MNNISIFDTENGVGSLIVKDVPYTRTAYVKIESVSFLDAYLEECVSFCRALGAEQIYAAGHDRLCTYPYHTTVICMECPRRELQDTDSKLIAVSEETLQQWLEIYRGKMQRIPNAAYMSEADGRQMLRRKDGYYIYRDDILLGIGVAAGKTIDLVASLQPGAGRQIVLALNKALAGETAALEVAAENEKAMRLYKDLGFKQTAVKSSWYKIF